VNIAGSVALTVMLEQHTQSLTTRQGLGAREPLQRREHKLRLGNREPPFVHQSRTEPGCGRQEPIAVGGHEHEQHPQRVAQQHRARQLVHRAAITRFGLPVRTARSKHTIADP